MEQSAPATSPSEQGDTRGRRRTRDSRGSDDDDADMDNSGGGEGGAPGSKKRRRSRKGLDKKFECPHEGCGKSYSRAEHLYRHQLNHNPKQIYACDFPDCHRTFVRQDLCARHKERHTARGSQLLRKDTFGQNINPIVTAALQSQNAAKYGKNMSPTISHDNSPYHPGASHPGLQGQNHPGERTFIMQSPASVVASSSTARSDASPPLDPTLHSPNDQHALHRMSSMDRVKSDDGYRRTDSAKSMDMHYDPRQSSFSQQNQGRSQQPGNEQFARPMQNHNMAGANLQSLSLNSPFTSAPRPGPDYKPQQNTSFPPASPSPFQPNNNFPPLQALPPPSYPMQRPATSAETPASYHNHNPSNAHANENLPAGDFRMSSVTEAALMESMTPTYSIPVFGGESYTRSPFAMADDFTAWLFNDSNFGPAASPMGHPGNNMANMPGNHQFGLQAPYFNYDPVVAGYFQQPPAPSQQVMAVNSILDPNVPESALSDDKRLQILELIEMRFNDTSNAPVKKREELFEGNKDDSQHVLSLHMMQTYIGSYWVHFHPQIPILHKPSFSPNHCPDLMLIAMMSLGASCLEKHHGYQVTQSCAELSNFLAWHLRWEIFMDADFRPPAKLWIFQTLLLLEIFEKMYSTRPLHERAHIHHATTLTLMRRGSSLIGRSSVDSPPSVKGERNGSLNGSVNQSGTNTPDEWWNQWITNEATRRAAFVAFMMDSIHATMFGHSAVMVAHEMRLPLPCAEEPWNANSGAEVSRYEQNLLQQGMKPITFLDGLKKTLNGAPVRTNSFGRTIIMAGLLSVSWHMNQRDLQVSSLGVTQALGGRDKWRGSLTRAFDFWKSDFDEALLKEEKTQSGAHHYPAGSVDADNVFEGKTVLHHLAHMAMHVDIVDCQIFAGANRLLGRSITPQDSNSAQRRMRDNWAPTARARDATFYALRFLRQVLVEDVAMLPNGTRAPVFNYSARDDFLLNRPWVLYFAILIVWSYGFALDGPIKPLYTLSNHEDRVRDMQGYLDRVGGVKSPEELAQMGNRNACLGLLVLMKDMFTKTRWELAHEASNLLTKCIDMLTGGQQKE
ncbi:hypothetical protein K402DRAFT_340009 [Aulographum hederae CBS 113979]|uniref:C2H2-type domain-containing protein n=1 Tax=Aulographum hederae CBS 113979 TaxID=1176131 RepID=A0A6G1GPE5_9PEZI|nr:hypothetical protein K402DRAFT_340009 [Aulographum hederae CBS 113979]